MAPIIRVIMESLIYIANVLYLLSYFVQDMLRLRILTVIAASLLVCYFYLQPTPMMTVVYWNIFFVALNAIQLSRIYRERSSSAEDESSDAEDMTPVA